MACSHTHCVYVHACVHHQLKEELGTKADKETTIKSVTMLSKAVSALEAELQPTRDTVIRLAHEISDKQDAGSAERCGVTPRRSWEPSSVLTWAHHTCRVHDLLSKNVKRLNRIAAQLAGKAEPAMGRRTAATRCLSCNRELRQPQLIPPMEGADGERIDPRNKRALRRPHSASAIRCGHCHTGCPSCRNVVTVVGCFRRGRSRSPGSTRSRRGPSGQHGNQANSPEHHQLCPGGQHLLQDEVGEDGFPVPLRSVSPPLPSVRSAAALHNMSVTAKSGHHPTVHTPGAQFRELGLGGHAAPAR